LAGCWEESGVTILGGNNVLAGVAFALWGAVCFVWARDASGGERGRHASEPLPSAEEIARLPLDGGPEFNRLIHERSPYLLQHARNPVDWYPWGEEAFQKARREDKPIFLSVGYSTCHWCHVMERESFENEDVAEVLNERFVSIKVDREERPDVDSIYMAAVQAMTGSGGWPMSVFLAPDGRPFWGGTYFPPEDRAGRLGFRRILLSIAHLWKNEREQLLQGAEELTRYMQALPTAAVRAEIGLATLRKGYGLYSQEFDAAYGGFGSAPKFPRPHSLSFLLRYWKRTGDATALTMVEATLDHMARGGIRDHLGGGFHRYSTDRLWLVPHFEKMLYDQALLARTYLEAYQVTGRREYATVAREIFRYVLRDMTDERGGFYSAEDADAEGVEGKFSVWPKEEVLRVLGKEDGEFFSEVYGVEEGGNYREEATGELTRSNILHLPRPIESVARELGVEPAALEERLAAMRVKLFVARERRVHPHKDDKIMTDWNGLMISSLAYGGQVLDEPVYIEAASRAASFLLETMERGGRLLHRYRAGEAGIKGYLNDYAFLCLGLLDLYEATFQVRWLREAGRLAEEMVRLFWDEEARGFFFSGRDGERLVAQTKDIYDGALPSGNSAAALVLLRLARLTMDAGLEERARETLASFSGQIEHYPMGYPASLMALDFELGPVKEVVLAGDRADPMIEAMRRAIYRRFLPDKVLALHPMGPDGAEIEGLVPFLKQQQAIGGAATAYVCVNYTCKLPTADLEEMVQLLDESC